MLRLVTLPDDAPYVERGRYFLSDRATRSIAPGADPTIAQLCATLTATETCFPTTDLRLVYRQVGSA